MQCPGLPPQPDLAAIKELEAIREAYTAAPENPRYRFHHLFLNVAPNPAACQKPQGVDELRWREAMQRAGGPNNPHHLWPVLAHGTKDLIARKDAQVCLFRFDVVSPVSRCWLNAPICAPDDGRHAHFKLRSGHDMLMSLARREHACKYKAGPRMWEDQQCEFQGHTLSRRFRSGLQSFW